MLVPRVADLLRIEPRPIRLILKPTKACLAFTRQAWAPDVPTIFVDPDCADDVVLAHEIAHCLVPSDWLFAAEGVAIWVSCRIGRGTAHLLFPEPTADAIVRKYWSRSASPETLADERVGDAGLLHSATFHRFEGRLAHAVAASFLGMMLETIPGLPAILSDPGTRERPLKVTLAEAAGMTFQVLQSRWREKMTGRDEPGPALS